MATWGSLKKNAAIPESLYGFGQGYFRYYKSDGTYESIVAAGGKLIRDGGVITITNLPDGFQTERMIEAVQWKDRLFIATGTKLVEYDGAEAKVVEDYKPTPFEYLYVGSNALAAFPDNFMQDGVHDNLRVEGLVPDLRKGYVGASTTFTAFISKPGAEVIEYKFEYRVKSDLTSLQLGQDWSTTKTWKFAPKEVGDYVVRVSARDQAVPATVEIFELPIYKVTAYNENETIDTSQMHTCNRILLHWNRIVMYGDKKNISRIYISHLNQPRYFPTNNSLDFENNQQEPLQKLVQYRDFIVAFTTSTIQALYGKGTIGDDPYRRVYIHTGMGTIAPESPQVMGNVIAFLSRDGIHILKSIGVVDEKMNVEKIDIDIDNLIPSHTDACGVVYDNQYHICFPQLHTRFRFYMELGVWTKDYSPMFDFSRFYEWDGDLVAQSQLTGRTFMFDEHIYDDANHVYEAYVKTKKYDFGEPHNLKKLKRQDIILTNETWDGHMLVEVYGDDKLIIGEQEASAIAERDEETNITKINLSPETKVRTVQTVIRHSESEPFSLLALGYVFKTRKP